MSSDAATFTMRVMVRTVPGDRDPLERAVRQAMIERLMAEGLWPTPPALPAPTADDPTGEGEEKARSGAAPPVSQQSPRTNHR